MNLFVLLLHYDDKFIATFAYITPPENLSKTFTFIICKYYEFPCETHIRKIEIPGICEGTEGWEHYFFDCECVAHMTKSPWFLFSVISFEDPPLTVGAAKSESEKSVVISGHYHYQKQARLSRPGCKDPCRDRSLHLCR